VTFFLSAKRVISGEPTVGFCINFKTRKIMLTKIIALLFLIALFGVAVLAQADEGTEPTTASNVADAILPWGAQRILPGKVPAEFNELYDKLLAEGGGKIASGSREVLAWQGTYKNRSKAETIKTELEMNFRKEGWAFATAASEGDVELFSLSKNDRAVLGFFTANEEVFVCSLMEVRKAGASPAQTDNRPTANSGGGTGGSIVGKWFRTTGGSMRDWTGKTTLKGGEDFTFVFSADGTVEYTRKKEILNVMQCRINSEENARGRYTLNGGGLTIDLGTMRSVGTNSCNARENYNKTLSNSTMTVQIQIKQMDDITRPDKPYTMCFDGNEVCYEKQH
jgi:hypothetical protein